MIRKFFAVVASFVMVMGVTGYVSSGNSSMPISIYVNDVESQVGIASIEFVDGMKISFKRNSIKYSL